MRLISRAMARFLAISLLSAMAACASAGNQFLKDADENKVNSVVIDGTSTKADVKAKFGDPNDTSFTDSGNEIWKYTYAYITPMGENFIPVVGIFAGGQNVDKKELVIFFDKNGIVQRHTLTFSKEQIKRGS